MRGDNLRDLAASASEALSRAGLDGLKAEVVLIVDVSRSMFPIYRAEPFRANGCAYHRAAARQCL